MRFPILARLLTVMVLPLVVTTLQAQKSLNDLPFANRPTPSRVVDRIDETRLVKLPGNTHPMARAELDRGLVTPLLPMERMVLVMKRSAEQEQELAALNARQYDASSPDFHHWVHADDFGRLFGPSDADMAVVTAWLESHGFSIYGVSKSRVSLQFSGTAAQVQEAFHLEMHRYMVEGVEHIANDRDPSIPEALTPVVVGLASLNDFRHGHGTHPGDYVKRDLRTGKFTRIDPQPGAEASTVAFASGVSAPTGGLRIKPEATYTDEFNDTVEDLAPFDYATIYNIMPLWNAGITGTGVKIAIVGVSDVEASDVATFRSAFGLPAAPLNTIKNGTDPGFDTTHGGQGENTLDVEMAGSSAPGATVELVVSASTATTGGDVLSAMYITDNEVAPIMSGSYGECELALGQSTNNLYNQTWQQGATAGISIFESAGDEGSAACNDQNTAPPVGDTMGLQVNGIASSPYVTAVGGTDLTWPFTPNVPLSTYWNVDNNSVYGNAKSYMPEMVWNSTCTNPALLATISNNGQPIPNTEQLCNEAATQDQYLVRISAGSGGVSNCTTPTGTTPATCAGGYAKPSWQTGSGVPNDGKRDIPDVATFASYGFATQHTGIPSSQLLLCMASGSPDKSCTYNNPEYIIFQENGGTSAATPLTAGVMALIIQKTGQTQGLANPIFYQLAATENYANCNSQTVATTNSCLFNDITFGTNSQVCTTGGPNCVTITAGDQYGTLSGYAAGQGYDLATGLGSLNVANLVNAWPKTTNTGPTLTITPSSLTFASTTVGTTTAAQVVTLKNTGTTAITFTAATTITGSGASSFSRSASTCSSPLAAGASCTNSVVFTPASTGTLTATITYTDSGSSTPQTVSLTGTGNSGSAATLSITPGSLTFASTPVGTTTAAQVVTLKNTGTTAITFTAATTLTGSGASSFSRSASTCSSPLAAGASCTNSVVFTPASTGTLTATITYTDSGSTTPQTVSLTGTGSSASAATLSITPGALTFASTPVGTSTAAQMVTLKNTGTTAITFTAATTLTGSGASSFSRSASTCSSPLAAGASCTNSVVFTPAATGTLTATITYTDSGSTTPQTVSLTGTGSSSSAPTLSVTPGALSFTSSAVGTASAAQVITLKNTGTTAITFTAGTTITGSGASSFSRGSTCSSPLAAGASCTNSVVFTPATTGTLTATITYTDSGSTTPQTVSLTGSVSSLSVTPGSLSFASTAVGTSTAAQVITLKNTGTSAITFTAGTTITGGGASSFSRSSTCSSPLAAGASCTNSIVFTPASTGALTATVTYTDSGSSAPQTVSLSGTGH